MSRNSKLYEVRVEPGSYELKFEYYETFFFLGRFPKVVLWFSILDFGEHNEKKLARYYNIEKIHGKPRRSGSFRFGRRSDFNKEYLKLFDKPCKKGVINWNLYKRHIILGEVNTVTNDFRGDGYHPSLVYSVLSRLKRVKEI